jgi:hypothetical protein
MHPGLAAVVLATTPSPSSTASTPPPHGGADWGNVPAWVAAIATVVGLAAAITAAVIAYRQFRQQTDVLKGEAERNKRRDELLDGELRDLRDREELRTREQAERVDVAMRADGTEIYVDNQSTRPITRIDAYIQAPLPDGGLEGRGVNGWLLGAIGRRGGGVLPVLRPRARATALLQPPPEVESWRGVVRFNDDAGRRWQLDQFMHLERAPDDDW